MCVSFVVCVRRAAPYASPLEGRGSEAALACARARVSRGAPRRTQKRVVVRRKSLCGVERLEREFESDEGEEALDRAPARGLVQEVGDGHRQHRRVRRDLADDASHTGWGGGERRLFADAGRSACETRQCHRTCCRTSVSIGGA